MNQILTGNDIKQEDVLIIGKLFYRIGHPKWFSRFRNFCRILRREQDERFLTSNGRLTYSLRLVRHAEYNELAGHNLRRRGLVGLVRRRNSQ